MDEQELLRLKPELDRFLDQFTPLFGRSENDGHARRFVQGLLRGGDRRNSENIAEATNGGPVRSLQAFVAPGVWSDRALLSAVRQAVVGALTDPDAVLNVDETGFPKKGTKSVGVQRQYSGTLGRVDNCQIGVFANYASSRGHAVVDRRWYLPEEWVEDGPRCQDAGVPEGVVFRTQPELAREMIADAIAAGVPFRWVGGDSVYGDNPTFVQGGPEARQVVRPGHRVRYPGVDPATGGDSGRPTTEAVKGSAADPAPDRWRTSPGGRGDRPLTRNRLAPGGGRGRDQRTTGVRVRRGDGLVS
ncbi:IS701 family transposase [Fimbriiglobus ruber]|uniref:Mobile element protein n=1 Tax=Fimbriiglobus ruber TaxID=1908690 RepID=A0A225DXF3_9BACT|nr:IS701 family transposase [Fimbriiglobus ruber]OWK44264.1 Mobile element protein [Fimbriiglobus ruber]